MYESVVGGHNEGTVEIASKALEEKIKSYVSSLSVAKYNMLISSFNMDKKAYGDKTVTEESSLHFYKWQNTGIFIAKYFITTNKTSMGQSLCKRIDGEEVCVKLEVPSYEKFRLELEKCGDPKCVWQVWEKLQLSIIINTGKVNQMRMTYPKISKQLKILEKQQGLQLFNISFSLDMNTLKIMQDLEKDNDFIANYTDYKGRLIDALNEYESGIERLFQLNQGYRGSGGSRFVIKVKKVPCKNKASCTKKTQNKSVRYA